jgi:hypothetical protein
MDLKAVPSGVLFVSPIPFFTSKLNGSISLLLIEIWKKLYVSLNNDEWVKSYVLLNYLNIYCRIFIY